MSIQIRSFSLGVCRLTLGLGLAILGIYRAYMLNPWLRWYRNSNRAITGPEYAGSWGPARGWDARWKGVGERLVGDLEVSENFGTLFYGIKVSNRSIAPYIES